MRHRITYVARASEDLALDQFEVISKRSVRINSLLAAKEHRITIDFSQLPHELANLLESYHELHVRWASLEPYITQAPFSSMLPPGLHVSVTARENSTIEDLCPILKKIFSPDMKCEDSKTSFSSPSIPSMCFTTSNYHQYFSDVPSLANFVRVVQQEFCTSLGQSCQSAATSVLSAKYLDIDYDAISHTVVVTALWNIPPESSPWREIIESSRNDRTEIGVFREEYTGATSEIKLGGWLAVIGENERPSPTRFSFASRHHLLPDESTLSERSALKVSLESSSGLHPTLQISLTDNGTIKQPRPTCALHAYLTVPSCFFIDRYQFLDPVFLASHQLVALHAISGATDLEAPDWAMKLWGSSVLIELEAPKENEVANWTPSIPFHLRYLLPNLHGYANMSMPRPAVFWACDAEESSPSESRMSMNPFDRVNIGYDGHFGDHKSFFHLGVNLNWNSPFNTPHVFHNVNTIMVPTLKLDAASHVGPATLATILLGFVWVSSSLFLPWKILAKFA